MALEFIFVLNLKNIQLILNPVNHRMNNQYNNAFSTVFTANKHEVIILALYLILNYNL